MFNDITIVALRAHSRVYSGQISGLLLSKMRKANLVTLFRVILRHALSEMIPTILQDTDSYISHSRIFP